jgi:hypothetical protein
MGGTTWQWPRQMPLSNLQLPDTGGGARGVCGFSLACAVLDSASAINAVIISLFIVFSRFGFKILASCPFFLTPARCFAMGRDRVK